MNEETTARVSIDNVFCSEDNYEDSSWLNGDTFTVFRYVKNIYFIQDGIDGFAWTRNANSYNHFELFIKNGREHE